MGLLNIFKKDADTLYISLDEQPQPRNAAMFSIVHGSRVMATSQIQMDTAGLDTACRVIDFHRAALQACGYKAVMFRNLNDFAQERIRAALK